MPDFLYPILSALLWAASAPVINIGLSRIKERGACALLWPMFYALSSGFIISLLLSMPRSPQNILDQTNAALIISGVLTFPLATGAYYAAGVFFNRRAEIASQFSKIKPLFTIGLALAFLPAQMAGEISWLSVFFLTAGIAIFIGKGLDKSISLPGVIIGLGTAFLWAGGEIFMKIGIGDMDGLSANTIALASGLVVYSAAIAILSLVFKKKPCSPIKHWPFIVHGALSFGLAYSFFFSGVATLGLSTTVLINAFWPALALIMATAINHLNGLRTKTPLAIWAAVLCLLIASILEIQLVIS